MTCRKINQFYGKKNQIQNTGIMNKKTGINFFFAIIAIITGSKLYKHFDFQNLKFEKPAIDTIYLIAFLASVIFIVKDLISRLKNNTNSSK